MSTRRAPPVRYTTSTAFLDDCSTETVLTYTVPTRYPIDETSPPAVLNQADHAVGSDVWFPPPALSATRSEREDSEEAGDGEGVSDGYVLSRLVEDGYTLELRWVAFGRPACAVELSSPDNDNDDDGRAHAERDGPTGRRRSSELDRHPGTLAPVRFTFPARVVPSPAFTLVSADDAPLPTSRSLQVLALTEAGYLYTLTFPFPTLFYDSDYLSSSSRLDRDSTGSEWAEEFEVEALSVRKAVLVEGADEGRCVVACEDGSAFVVEIAEGSDGALIETELRSPSSFSIRSLVPSFSHRSHSASSSASASPTKLVAGSSSHSSSAPSQLVSLAISNPAAAAAASTFAFGVSRDRKLKIWNVESGQCLRSIDLPKSTAALSNTLVASDRQLASPSSFDSPDVRSQKKSTLLLPPNPQSFVKLVESSSTRYGSYLVLYTPPSSSSSAAFFIYGLATDASTGDLSELAPVAERACPPDVGEGIGLVDFDVKRMNLAGDDEWTLWTVWDEAGETDVRTVSVSELEDDGVDNYEVVAKEDGDDRWTTVARGQSISTSHWTAAYFDDQLRNSPLSVPETFLRHVSRPGRYPPATFEYALEMYEDVVLNEYEAAGVPPPAAFDHAYDSPLVRAAAIVGSTVELAYSPQTGAPLLDEYTKRLKTEWLRFVALLNESRQDAVFPTKLAVDEARGVAFVVGRDCLTVPVVEARVASLARQLDTPTIDLNLAPLFSTYPESNFVQLASLVQTVKARLSTADERVFEQAVLDRVRTPFTTDMEDVALDLFERTLEPVLAAEALETIVEGLKGFVEPFKTVEAFCRLLVSTEPLPPPRHPGESASTELTAALVADLVSSDVEARFTLAKGLVAVLIAAWGASDEEGSEIAMAGLDQATSLALSTLHSIATLEWTSTQIVAPTFDAVEAIRLEAKTTERADSNGDRMLEQFGRLKMGDPRRGSNAEVLPVPTSSLLNALVRIPPYAPPLTSSEFSTLTTSLASAASSVLASTGVLTLKPIIDSTPEDALFSYSLVRLGLAEQAKELVKGYPTSSGFAYVLGRAELDLGNGDDAAKAFERAASGLFALEIASADSSLSSGGLSRILPSSVTSLSAYYIHLVSLFVPTPFDYSIARFAELALDALDDEGVDDDETKKDLWSKIFRSYAAVGEYEKAYQAIMGTPFPETRTTCLAHFISLVCENGATSLLTTLSFVGLEADLERNLAFRARNSDPLARPDYHKVLYAWHVSKGDYRSAGTVMYQQARRIAEITARGGSFRELATVQCQAYLAAANALSLVEKEHAWVAVVVGDDLERGNKRRKVTYHIPDDEYEPSASRPLEVRELSDIRREYTVALARLHLSDEFPELERTNFHLDPEAVVALLSQTNAFDQAFQAARVLDVDLSSLFEILAEKCVALSANPESAGDSSWVSRSPETVLWSGSLSDKAWRLLALHLARHDSAPTFTYHLVVLERVLALDRTGFVPTFLREILNSKVPSGFVRTLTKYERIREAFEVSTDLVKSAELAPSSTAFSTTLPYSLFDQLLALKPYSGDNLSSSASRDATHLPREDLDKLQAALRDELKSWTAKVEKASGPVRSAGAKF
ncbi:hypothetical protein JCM10212_007031 [Sporobolomyces blumeae]